MLLDSQQLKDVFTKHSSCPNNNGSDRGGESINADDPIETEESLANRINNVSILSIVILFFKKVLVYQNSTGTTPAESANSNQPNNRIDLVKLKIFRAFGFLPASSSSSSSQ